MFASISSICNAAIHRLGNGGVAVKIKGNIFEVASCDSKCSVHSGVITNAGGKVIVRKMAGQNIYKGSNSNGVRSLSLPKWRESFVVSGIDVDDEQQLFKLSSPTQKMSLLCFSGEAQEGSHLPIYAEQHPPKVDCEPR